MKSWHISYTQELVWHWEAMISDHVYTIAGDVYDLAATVENDDDVTATVGNNDDVYKTMGYISHFATITEDNDDFP